MHKRLTARLASREAGLLSVILAGALGIRLLGVSRGLPYIHEYDEPSVLSYVIGMLQRGDFNPGTWVYPNVYYYMLLPVMYLHYWYLHANGMLSSPWDIRLYHPQVAAYWWYLSPASFYLWGRIFTALVGTATIYLVYRLGKTVYSPAVGLLAATLLALAPGAVYYADTVRVDIPMAFFVTLTILAGCGIIRHGRWQDYLLTGLLAGLAISTKTNAVIVVLALLVAHLMSPRRTRLVDLRLVVMGLCVLAGGVVGTPYLIITPHIVIKQVRDQALAYGGIPSFTSVRQMLPGYLAYFVRPSQGSEWYVIPHTAVGLLPAAAAALGAVVGFRWDRRLHLYLLSFPLPYFLFMSGQRFLALRNMMPLLPFAGLFAAAGCLWAWHLIQTRWPAAPTSWARALTALALAVLLAAPGRDAVALGWMMGHKPDTRAAAGEWLRQHASPGARIALEQDLRWYLPDLDRLPVALRFAPRDAKLAWYLQQHIDFAVIGAQSPLRSLPAAAVLPRPPYLRGEREGEGYWPQELHAVIDPTLYIVRPKMPEINAVFPVDVGNADMIPEPIVRDAAGVYSETVRLPDQHFTPGSYTLALTGGRLRPGGSYIDRLTAKVLVGQVTVGKVTLTGSRPLGFTTPAFRINQDEILPVQIALTFWIQQPQTPGQGSQPGWALRPSASGCATAPDAPNLNIQQLTVEAWVYLERMNEPPNMRARGLESEAPILDKSTRLGYYLRLVGDRDNRIFADLSVAGKFSVGRAGFVPFRKWTHIAATYDGHEARIYLNGVPAPPERDPHHDGAVHAAGEPLITGCRDPGTPDQTVFNGLITRVRIWNRVLPPDAIRDEARLRLLPDTSAGLVGSWSFQSLVHGRVPDLSGAGNNLTAQTLQRVPIDNGQLARPEWMSGELNLLRTVRIDRVTP